MRMTLLNRYKLEIKWALYFSAMMLIWMFGEKMAGLHSTNIAEHANFSNLVSIPAIAIYFFALIEIRNKKFEGLVNFKQAITSGIVMTGVITLLSPITQIITSLVISPEYFENVIKYAVQSNMMTQQEAEDYFNLTNYITQTVIFTPIMGLVTTVLVGFILSLKKAK